MTDMQTPEEHPQQQHAQQPPEQPEETPAVPPCQERLAALRGRHMNDEDVAAEAVALAEELLHSARQKQTPEEQQQAQKVARMMQDPRGKALTIALSDQVFRSHQPQRIADQLRHLLRRYGSPRYLGIWDRVALSSGGIMGQWLPGVVVPRFTAQLRQETQALILPGEEQPLRRYLRERRRAGIRLNLNQLGEAVLGEDEARRRLDDYLALLANDYVDYISVKLSSIFSQINLIAFDDTLAKVKERLRELYRMALMHTHRAPDGKQQPKFINLDMEEYRDLHLTVAAFRAVLDEPEFQGLRAGLVLQAYLPDSYAVQQELTDWALNRCQRGGAPIKIRIVKGANLAMEQVEASIHGWKQAPYGSKAEVDANFKRMVAYGCQPQRAAAVNLGIASHNLFDIAYGMVLRAIHELDDCIDFEMLEGMANHQARAVKECAGDVLLYAPVVRQEDFHNAIAYLVRRLDENSSEENFLHDLFDMQPGTPPWKKQRDAFLHACRIMGQVEPAPRRSQDRRSEQEPLDAQMEAPFANVPDTDWSLPANQAWIQAVLSDWQQAEPEAIPLQIGGELLDQGVPADLPGEGYDPSRSGVVAYRYALADHEQVERALDAASQAQPAWGALPIAERRAHLIRAAAELAHSRGDLIGSMVLDGAKLITEADAEVSEAIDFANYYARSLDLGDEVADCRMQPLGVVVVAPPWNFPLAIPAGGVLAALMAGNAVILKPAREAVLVSWRMVQALWRAGIPREVLQFVPCADNEVGQQLITDARTAAVILTGARGTALMFHDWKPDIRLFAETSGKNSLIISAMADHDQAIKDLVRSAFGHNGQKCSAASLAICEAEVYDNPDFRRQLRDAAASLPVGGAWNPANRITPLTQPPGENLQRALTMLEEGEEWLLEPRVDDVNPQLWSPGIKIGVRPGSFFHQTECFGPVLGLMRAENLEHAVALANDTLYGLTGGLHSLDDREQDYWQQHIQVGNAYINRHITGAIVRRQSFGGWKGSVFGPGAKAGGPNYVLQLAHWYQEELPQQQAACSPEVDALVQHYQGLLPEAEQRDLLVYSAGSYAHAWQQHYGQAHDPSALLGEANIFRYCPCQAVLLRAGNDVELVTVCQVALAARTCGTPLTISLPPTGPTTWAGLALEEGISVVFEDDTQLLSRLRHTRAYERLRVPGACSPALRKAAHYADIAVIDAPVLANGRLELRYYLKEQALSHTLHRYGNILQSPDEMIARRESKKRRQQA